ncbi:class I SAM-dependent methyltransferase [Microbacterium sp. LWH11-1.2]|uniref:class I SAM-dependent methyltransferase n=1 Tax=Microbacterium sp. LWH11-1.2 TaxID=3135258 RepID=UPI003138ACD4
MRDPRHFEGLADVYAAARPPYPTALWDAVRDLGVLQPGRRALDLGAGTGQATGPLLAAGLSVTAVEPGPRLAEQLRMRHPEATVLVDRAEDVELPPESFDLVVVATAVHWMDLGILLPKLHRVLAAGGHLLVWRTVFGDAAAPVTPFREQVTRIVHDRQALDDPGTDTEDAAATAASLTASGLFTVADISRFRWDVELDVDQVRRLFATFSNWSAEEVDRAASAARDLGGRVVEHYSSWLIVLRPTDAAIPPRGS